MKNIYPCLWFDDEAEEAANFYVSIFKNSKIGSIVRYGEEASLIGRKKGAVMTVTFNLNGQEIMTLNGGPQFKFTQAISFFVGCRTENELNYFWKKLGADGNVLMKLDKYPFSDLYGWVQDKYGVSWQLILGDYEQKITPLMLFADDRRGNAEEAMNFYASIFKNSKITRIERYSKDEGLEGTVKYAAFNIHGQNFMAMDSHNDAAIKFNEAISFVVNCETQAEIDDFWEKLSIDGIKGQCGWLKDKFGVSWQVVPITLGEMLKHADEEASTRVMKAIMSMTKIEIKDLQKAYNQKTAEHDLVIQHVVDAPHNLVWKAFTETELLKHWWGPKGFLMKDVKLDLRPGGLFHYSMISPEGNMMWGKFVYQDIEPKKRLVFINSFSDEKGGITRHPMSDTWPLEVFNTLELKEHNGKTTITLKGHPINATENELKTFEDGRESMQKGFQGTWEQLDLYLEKIQYVPNM